MIVILLEARTGELHWVIEVEERFKFLFIPKGIQKNLQTPGNNK